MGPTKNAKPVTTKVLEVIRADFFMIFPGGSDADPRFIFKVSVMTAQTATR